MNRILLSGDWHGAPASSSICVNKAVGNKCDAIVQLGDFGIWTHMPDGRKFLEAVSENAVKKSIPVYFLDGNHENFDDLEVMAIVPDGPFKQLVPYWDIQGHTPGEPLPGIYYIPRGARWTWGRLSFLGLGGAFSIDKTSRLEYERMGAPKLWWQQELITDEDEARAKEGGQVDVLLTHDAPWRDLNAIGLPQGYKVDPVSARNRERVEAVLDAVKPMRLWHGHYHHRYTRWWARSGYETEITGLDCGGPEMYELVDLAALADQLHGRAHKRVAQAEDEIKS